MYEKLYQLKDQFLKEWPLSRIQNLTLEEYTNLDKTSFTYWIEHTTEPTGGIRGGSSYKFGIYRMAKSSNTKPAANRTNNGTYAWYIKYGESPSVAFTTVKAILLKIVEASTGNNLEKLDKID